MAAKLGIGLPRLPWHLTDIWWRFENPTANFESLEVDVTIDRDIPEKLQLVHLSCGNRQDQRSAVLWGLQTNVNGWASKKVELECIRVAVPSFLAGLMISSNR